MKYWAFISYAHSDNRQENRLWADWLQDRLEGFVVPPELVGTEGRFGPLPERIYPVFQDDKELPTSADLGTAISEALEESRVLVVLCSPNSARSHWVNEEVVAFKRLGREGNIIAALLWGEPGASGGKEGFSTNDECFPEGLRYHLGPDGEVDHASPAEPIAADLRDPESGAQPFLNEERLRAHFDREFLRITAGVLGVGFESLVQRNVERERREAKARRLRKVVLVALSVVTVLGALIGVTSYLESQRERRVSLERKFESALVRSAEGRVRGNFVAGWRGLQEARSLGGELGGRERELAMEAQAYLGSTRHPLAVLCSPEAEGKMLVGMSLHDRSHTGLLVDVKAGELVEFDLFTHTEKRRLPVVGAPDEWEPTFRLCHGPQDEEPTTIVVAGDGGGLVFLDYETGEVTAQHDFAGGVSSMRANWEADLVAVTVAAQQFLRLYRLSDGAEVTVVSEEGDETMEGWQVSWLDRNTVVVACNDGACRVINTEGETTKVLRPENDLGSFLSICATPTRVVAGTGHGELVFWARASWEFEGQIKLAASEPVLSITKFEGQAGVEPEKHLAVLTLQGTLAWIDPVGRRIVDRCAIGGSPRMGLALSRAGVLYATGRQADAWVHRSRPQLRWRFPGANLWDLDGWEVHGRERCLVGGAQGSGQLVIMAHDGQVDGEGLGLETSLRVPTPEVERVHVDPRDPRRLLVVQAEELWEIELQSGQVVAVYPRPAEVEEEELGVVRGVGFRPEGGVFLVRSKGGVVRWAEAGAEPELLESGWETIRTMVPVVGERRYVVAGGDGELAVLNWDADGQPVLEKVEVDGELLGLARSDRGPCVVLSASDGEAVGLLFLNADGSVAARREVPMAARMVRTASGKNLLPLALSDRAGLLARVGGRGIQLHDLSTGRLLHELGDLEGEVERLAFFGARDALVHEVTVGGLGDGEVLQSVWDWRDGELLLGDGLEELANLHRALPKEVLPRYFMARGAPTHALLAAVEVEGWDGLLDPRAASRFGVEVLFDDGELTPDEDRLVAYMRRQAEINQAQFLRTVEPATGNSFYDWGASRVGRRVLSRHQEKRDQFPEDLGEVLELVERRTAYERAEDEPPLLRGLLLARKPEPEGLAAVQSLELAFDRLPEAMDGERSGRAEDECRHLVTAARLFDDWREDEARTEERAALGQFVGANFDRFLQQYFHYRDATWGDSVPYSEQPKTYGSVEELGRFTIAYNLALAHRGPTLQLCRDLLLAAEGADAERSTLMRAGLQVDAFNALTDEERDRVGAEELETVAQRASEVLESATIIEDPFLSALRAMLLVAEREIRQGRNAKALQVLGSLADPAARGLRALPQTTDLPRLVSFVPRLKLRIARLDGRGSEQLDLLQEGMALLSPEDDQPVAARVRRLAAAGKLARETFEQVEGAAEKIVSLRLGTTATEAAFVINSADFLEKKAQRDSGELDVIAYNDAVRAYRRHLEAHVDSCQWLGSTCLDAGLRDRALLAYRRANDALMEVLDTGTFSNLARRELAWHRIWTLQRIATIELEARPDAPGSQRALLTWEAAAATEARAVEQPETKLIINWAEAVDRIAESPDRALLEQAVKAYGTLIEIVDDLEFEELEEERLRQRILIVGHFNRAFLCREHQIRGIDIVGTLETVYELVQAYAAEPGVGTWEYEMHRKILVELEREYRGDGESGNAEEVKGRLEALQEGTE